MIKNETIIIYQCKGHNKMLLAVCFKDNNSVYKRTIFFEINEGIKRHKDFESEIRNHIPNYNTSDINISKNQHNLIMKTFYKHFIDNE